MVQDQNSEKELYSIDSKSINSAHIFNYLFNVLTTYSYLAGVIFVIIG